MLPTKKMIFYYILIEFMLRRFLESDCLENVETNPEKRKLRNFKKLFAGNSNNSVSGRFSDAKKPDQKSWAEGVDNFGKFLLRFVKISRIGQ